MCGARRRARQLAGPGAAQDGLQIVRDSETGALFQDHARPIFTAAGTGRTGVQILLLPSDMFNPFVAGPTRMFVNTGAFIHAKVPNEMIGAITRAIGIAEGATAQRRLVEETRQGARRHASGAQAKLKLGTPAWLRADDIVSYKPPKHHERPVRRPAETFA